MSDLSYKQVQKKIGITNIKKRHNIIPTTFTEQTVFRLMTGRVRQRYHFQLTFNLKNFVKEMTQETRRNQHV